MKKFLLCLSLFSLIFFLSPRKVFALCGNGVCEDQDYWDGCYSQDCQVGDNCLVSNCPEPLPSNVCCAPGVSCPGGQPTWTYAHNAQCVIDGLDDWHLDCSWHWQYEYCSAADRCGPCSNASGGEKVCAGQCADSGCVSGGWYKTCCQVNGAVQAGSSLSSNGSCSDGGCSSGANVRWSDFASPGPSCSSSLCLQSFDGYSWTVGSCGSTPGPTAPPGATATPTPGGGSEPGESKIYINVPQSQYNAGAQIPIEVCQKPNCCWNSAFFYNDIQVKTAGQPAGVDWGKVVCTASGFQSSPHCNSCAFLGNATNTGQDKTCVWDTSGYPSGTYTLEVYYGNHSGQGACDDGAKTARTTVQLIAPTPTPPPAPTPTPLPCAAVNIACGDSTGNSIGITWQLDNSGQGDHVDILRDFSPLASGLPLTSPNSYTDSGVASGSYRYNVSCVDAGGTGRGDAVICSTADTCIDATNPSIGVANNKTYENIIDFSVAFTSDEIKYEAWESDSEYGSYSLRRSPEDCVSGASSPLEKEELVNTDNDDKWVIVKATGKNLANGKTCVECQDNVPGDGCCVSDRVEHKRCSFCRHPDPASVMLTELDCGGGFTGTTISWTNRSAVQNGSVVYICNKGGSCPVVGLEDKYIQKLPGFTNSAVDCSNAFGTKQYAVRCYTDICGTPDDPDPTPTPTPTTGVVTPTVTSTPIPTPLPSELWIYGYVKDESHGDVGVAGASIRLDTKAGVGPPYVVPAATTQSGGSDGYWEFRVSPAASVYQFRVFEENAIGCSEDGRDPDYPDSPDNWHTGANTVEWRNPPNSAGAITFYDRCEGLVTPTPVGSGECTLGCPEGNSFKTSSGCGVLLGSGWQCENFTAVDNGPVNELLISAAAPYYTGGWRSATCKVTDSSGTVDISVGKQTESMIDSAGTTGCTDEIFEWKSADFTGDEFDLETGVDYKICCKADDSWPVRWDSSEWSWGIKNYVTCQCEAPPAGTVQGTIWDDANADAVCNLNEEAFGGVTISYNSGEGEVVSSNGSLACDQINYQFSNVLAERVITVYYDPDLLPSGYYPVTPYQDTGYLSDGGTLTINFAVSDKRPLWFQAAGGGIWTGSGPIVSVPEGEQLIIDDEDGNRLGALVTGSNSVNLGEGSLSDEGWLTLNQNYLGPNYYISYFDNRLERSSDVVDAKGNETKLSDVDDLNCGAASCNFGADSVVILRRNSATDFTIDRNVTVASGGFFAVLSKGDLIVEGGITQLDGLYLTEGDFEVKDGGSQLVINGSVSAVTMLSSQVLTERDLGEDNKTTPGVVFDYRPDLIFNMPTALWKAKFKARELSP